MTDQLLSLAREVGASVDAIGTQYNVAFDEVTLPAFVERIRQEERERCAAICDDMERQQENDNGAANTGGAAACAAAIRSSGTSGSRSKSDE